MTSDTLEKIDRARVVVAELNYGKREWKGLHEPASEDATDVVIMEALRCAALEISRLTRELEQARRERSAAKAESMTAQASLRRAERELEAARERERHIEGQIVALVEAEVISEGKAREILGVGVDEWREIEDRTLGAGTDT